VVNLTTVSHCLITLPKMSGPRPIGLPCHVLLQFKSCKSCRYCDQWYKQSKYF